MNSRIGRHRILICCKCRIHSPPCQVITFLQLDVPLPFSLEQNVVVTFVGRSEPNASALPTNTFSPAQVYTSHASRFIGVGETAFQKLSAAAQQLFPVLAVNATPVAVPSAITQIRPVIIT